MTPEQALKVAREHVQALYSEKNERGYQKFPGSASDVLQQELTVARFLLEHDSDNG